RHERHGGEVVHLVRADLVEDARQRHLVEQVSLVQLESLAQMLDALKVLGGGAADHAADAVALVQKQFGEVATVLAGDARDECGPGRHPVLAREIRAKSISYHSAEVAVKTSAFRLAATRVFERSAFWGLLGNVGSCSNSVSAAQCASIMMGAGFVS